MFYIISNCSGTFVSNLCQLSQVMLRHLIRATATFELTQYHKKLVDSVWDNSYLDVRKERPSCVVPLLCFSAFAASDLMIHSFPLCFISLFAVLLGYFAFPLHSLLFVLFCTCPLCRRTFGVWGGEEACYSKYLLFFHSFPSFTLTASLLTEVKPSSVKDSTLAPVVAKILRPVLVMPL